MILAAFAAPLVLPFYYWSNEISPAFDPMVVVAIFTAYLMVFAYGIPVYAWLQRKGWANIFTAALLGLTAIVGLVPLLACVFEIWISKGEALHGAGQMFVGTLDIFRSQPFVYIVPAVVVSVTFHGLVRGLNWLACLIFRGRVREVS